MCVGALQQGGDEGGNVHPTLKYRGPPMYWSPPPHFYHNIYFDWLVPPTYTPSFQRPYMCGDLNADTIGALY